MKLADKFQQLDVEHMTLKQKVVPILKLLKTSKAIAETLKQENQVLDQALQAMTLRYEALQCFEGFLDPDFQALLQEAEAQSALVDETLQEMDVDLDPDLDALDKALLVEYQDQPETFEALLSPALQDHAAVA